MTNAEKFVEVFGTDLKRQYATKSWWDQEFVPAKTGHWIVLQKDEWDSASLNHIKCSECGKEPFGDISSYFCPNCGADMRGAKMEE